MSAESHVLMLDRRVPGTASLSRLAVKYGFQPAGQIHEPIGDARAVGVVEFQYKIEVTALRIKGAGDSGAKEPESPHLPGPS